MRQLLLFAFSRGGRAARAYFLGLNFCFSIYILENEIILVHKSRFDKNNRENFDNSDTKLIQPKMSVIRRVFEDIF